MLTEVHAEFQTKLWLIHAQNFQENSLSAAIIFILGLNSNIF